jgi:glycogen phosphorylase
VVTVYNRIKVNIAEIAPRTVIFAGKAAPGYIMAKLIIKLINSVAETINNDPVASGLLQVVFLPNYCVSQAEKIIPAADLSEQISTAGMEASGTGNMKFALNGALTIGTLDGANVEILQEVGEENIFIFGHKAEEVSEFKSRGYNPRDIYEKDIELKSAVDLISSGFFSRGDFHLFEPIIDALLNKGDYYCVLADYRAYMDAQDLVARLYRQPDEWARRAILNTANMGKFSSDRAVSEYAQKVWNVSPVEV